MKLVYVDPSMKGYRQLYIRLSWRTLLFLFTVAVSSLILQTLEQSALKSNIINEEGSSVGTNESHIVHTAKRKLRVDYSEIIRNFSKQNDIPIQEVQKLVARITVEDDVIKRSAKPSYLEAMVAVMSIFFTFGWIETLPTSTTGKVFCSLVSTVGIPITYFMIVTAAEILTRQLQDLICCFTNSGTTKQKCNNPVVCSQLLPYLILLYIGYVQISTGLFMVMTKETSYADALFHSSMMLSTVGISDAIRTDVLNGEVTVSTVCVFMFLFVWTLFGLVVEVANLLLVFSVRFECRDVVTVRSVKSVIQQRDSVALVTHVEGREQKRYTLLKGAGKNLRYLFTS